MDDDDDDRDEPEVIAYEAVLDNHDWARTRRLVMAGQVFRHEKHAATVHPGVQHTLFVWICHTRRPQTRCPCGLYTITWLGEGSSPRP
jgi:hypothetical protein